MSSFAQAFSGPTRMGGHFVDMFPKGQDITWNLLPYIAIWVIFALILLVSPTSLFVHSRVSLTFSTLDLALHYPLCP